jgi:small subunit ribosomal protein S15Ae
MGILKHVQDQQDRVISPRYNVRLGDLENGRCFSTIVHSGTSFTTSAGIMDHEEARRKHVAGKIIGFFY